MRKWGGGPPVGASGNKLQCGRIYKDAEIRRLLSKTGYCFQLQCGRIYKDAEIARRGTRTLNAMKSFNVAASIKMRKSEARDLIQAVRKLASMWPHL